MLAAILDNSFQSTIYHLPSALSIPQKGASHKEVNHTDNNKKPSEPSEAERWALKNVPTAQLVAELSNREGVEATIAEPYQDAEVKVNGPAIVLVVID